MQKDQLKKAAELAPQASCIPRADRRMWLEVAQLQMDKTYEWIKDRYADDLLGPEQPAPGSASAAAGAAGEDAPFSDADETKLLAGDVVGSRSHFDRFRHLR